MSAAAIPGLSVRLRNIAEMVTPGSRLADVGTDHAWLPVWLCMQGRINAAVAMDLREGPLAVARVHIREAGLEKKIAVRLSDGLRELKTGEADCIVIAGMGGELIRRILADDADRLHTYSELILGPQSEPEKLRSFLEDQGFLITDERFIRDNGKYYPVLKAVPSKDGRPGMTAEETAYGPCLLKKQDPVLKEWLLKRKNAVHDLMEKLKDRKEGTAPARAEELKKEEQLLAAALKRYEM